MVRAIYYKFSVILLYMQVIKAPIKVIGYCRVSDIKQKDEGHSIDAQKEFIKQFCLKKDLQLVNIYSEQISGSSKCLLRPEFKNAINDLSSGKAFGLVCTKFDRLSRDLKDLVNVIHDYFKNKYKIFFTDFDHIDINTPEGMFQLNLFGSFAQLERSMIAKRTKNVLDYKKSKNEKTGGYIPYGKKVEIFSDKGKDIKKLVDNPEEISLIKELRDLKISLINGKKVSYNQISQLLVSRGIVNRNGLIKWSPQQVQQMIYPELSNRVIKIK